MLKSSYLCYQRQFCLLLALWLLLACAAFAQTTAFTYQGRLTDGGSPANGSYDLQFMNSFNHYAIGAVGEWMDRVILGINQDDAKPAYEHFVIHPYPGGGLTWAKGSYNSMRGKIESSWSVEGGGFKLDVTIPANTSATVYVPAKNAESVLESGKPASQAAGVQFARMEGGAAVVEVQAGRYRFAAP